MDRQSFQVDDFVKVMSEVVNLPIQDEFQAGVMENIERMMTIAQLVLEFPLSEEIETAPIFKP